MAISNPVHRVLPQLLVGCAVSVVVVGVFRHLTEPGTDWVSMRVVLTMGLLVAAGLSGGGASRRVVETVLRVLAGLFGVWLVLLQWSTRFDSPWAPMAVAGSVLCVVVFDRLLEALGFIGLFGVLMLVAGWHVDALPEAAGLAIATWVSTGAILMSGMQRAKLTRRVEESHSQLEREVAERTSELRREVQDRRAAEIRALAASDAKSRFLANMSHELRTPLNAIIGYSELVHEELSDPQCAPQEARSDLRRITRAADRLLGLVNDVLDLARIEADMMEILADDLCPSDLVAEACEEVRPLASRRGNRVHTELAAAPPRMRADAARLRQILVNLLSNAAKFTRDGEITVGVQRQDVTVRFEVKDTGMGIEPEMLPTLFDRFTQVDGSSTRSNEGTGLGLALSRDLARRMGGELIATSEPGVGSTFVLLLPLDAEATLPGRSSSDIGGYEVTTLPTG